MQEIGRILKGKTTVLLDLDGTLVDSVNAHAVSWKKVLSRHGHEVDLSSLERLIGMGEDKMLRSAIGEVSEAEEKVLTDERSSRFRKNEIRDVRPFERALELIKALRENGLTVMLATAASADDRDALLKQGGLQDAFEEFVSSDQVEGSKTEHPNHPGKTPRRPGRMHPGGRLTLRRRGRLPSRCRFCGSRIRRLYQGRTPLHCGRLPKRQ